MAPRSPARAPGVRAPIPRAGGRAARPRVGDRPSSHAVGGTSGAAHLGPVVLLQQVLQVEIGERRAHAAPALAFARLQRHLAGEPGRRGRGGRGATGPGTSWSARAPEPAARGGGEGCWDSARLGRHHPAGGALGARGWSPAHAPPLNTPPPGARPRGPQGPGSAHLGARNLRRLKPRKQTNKQTKKNGRLSGSKETNIPERDSLAPSHLRGVHPSSEGTKYLLNKTNISCAYQSSGLCAICTHICLINTWLLDPKRITSQYYKQYITLRNLVPIFQDLLAKKRKTQGKSLQPNHSVFSAERLSSCD